MINSCGGSAVYIPPEGSCDSCSDLRKAIATKQNLLSAGDNITISNNTISAKDTTYQVMTGASSSQAGKSGLVPQPSAGSEGKFLRGDGTWADLSKLFIRARYACEYTSKPQPYSTIKLTAEDFGIVSPEGYVPFSIASATTGDDTIKLLSFAASDTGEILGLINAYAFVVTATAEIEIVFAKASLLG